jgi:hypothetical protein
MIKITQGDTALLTFTAKNGEGVAVDLTGAVFSTEVVGKDNEIVNIPNASHTVDPDQVTNTGKFVVSLTAAETAAFSAEDGKEIVTEITQGGSVINYRAANILTVYPKQPRK